MVKRNIVIFGVFLIFSGLIFSFKNNKDLELASGIIKYNLLVTLTDKTAPQIFYSDTAQFYRYGTYLFNEVFETKHTNILSPAGSSSTKGTIFTCFQLISLTDHKAYEFDKDADVLKNSFSLKDRNNTGLHVFFEKVVNNDSIQVLSLKEQQLTSDEYRYQFKTKNKNSGQIIDYTWVINKDWDLSAFKVELQTQNKRISGFLKEAVLQDKEKGLETRLICSYTSGLDKEKITFFNKLIQLSINDQPFPL